MAPDSAQRLDTLHRLTLLTLPYLIPLLYSIHPVIDPDLWWHLRTGQWIVEHGTVPRVDSFSAYGMGKAMVAYTWPFDVIVYGVYRAFGLVGIVLFTALLSLLIAVALHKLVRRFALPFGGEILLIACGLAALGLVLNHPRPWLFTILFFILELDLILTAQRSGNSRPLWLLPPLFVVWANVHIQFSYGLFLLGLATLEPLIDKISLPSPMKSATKSIPFYQLLQVLIACFVATLVTPYHAHLYSTLINFIRQTGFFQVIVEAQPLPFRETYSWMVLFLALGAACSLGWQRNVRPFPFLSLAAGAFLSFRGRRDLWFIVIVAVPIIATSFSTSCSTQRFSLTKLRVALVTGTVILALIVIGWKRNISEANLESVVAEWYPVAAAAVVENRGYQGPLFNEFGWGGYLMWRLRSMPVNIDSRGHVHGDERVVRSMETWLGWKNWHSDPELVSARLVIAGTQTALASLLRLDSRFELVYEDKVAAVFVARPQRATQQMTTTQSKSGESLDKSTAEGRGFVPLRRTRLPISSL